MDISVNDDVLAIEAEGVGDSATVAVRGAVDASSTPRLQDVFAALRQCGARDVVIDLRECTFLDSSGLRALMSLRRRCLVGGGRLLLRAPSEAALRVLAATATLRLFHVESPQLTSMQRVG